MIIYLAIGRIKALTNQITTIRIHFNLTPKGRQFEKSTIKMINADILKPYPPYVSFLKVNVYQLFRTRGQNVDKCLKLYI